MKKLILLLLVLIPAVAFARFEKITEDVNNIFGGFSGYVVAVDGDKITTDLGLEQGVFNGLEMKIYRESEAIYHPITKQLLGKKKVFIGDVLIKDVYEKFSEASASNLAEAPVAGDVITMNPPVAVDVKIVNFPDRLGLLLKEELGTAYNIMVKDDAPLSLSFTQEENGGITAVVTDKGSHKVVYSKFYSDKELGKGLNTMSTKDIVESDNITKVYKSFAVGHVKPDSRIYIAAATTHNIDFYIFDEGKFKYVDSMDKEFDNIQNVELADLDNDTVDEIFVTELKHESTVRSSIFEHDGQTYKMLQDNMQYIFRTVTVMGEKKVVAQKLAADGTYIGMVHKFLYVGGHYDRGSAITNLNGIGIYGFGYSDIDGDGVNEILSIDADNKMNVYNGKDVKYTSVEEFGQTPYFYLLKAEMTENLEFNDKAHENDPFEQEVFKKYIKGRVFVNSEGKIFVVQNDKQFEMFVKAQSFKDSKYAVYRWDGKRLMNIWKSDIMKPVIADYYMFEEFGRTYLFLLRNEKQGMFKDDTSKFVYLELE